MRLLGLGDNTVDIYVDQGLEYPGGNAVNVAVFARRLGAETAYLGCVGNDDRAARVMHALTSEGVDVSRVRHLEEVNSWSRIRHDGADRVFDGSHLIDRTKYRLVESDFAFMRSFNHCHTSLYSGLDGNLAEIQAASRCLSYDFSEEFTDAHLEKIGPRIDIAFLSGADRDLEQCNALAARLQALGCSLTVITRGARGSMCVKDGVAVHAKPAPADVGDTLGAGDGFIAGFLVAFHAAADSAEALRQGAVSAAQACSSHGAFGYQAKASCVEGHD